MPSHRSSVVSHCALCPQPLGLDSLAQNRPLSRPCCQCWQRSLQLCLGCWLNFNTASSHSPRSWFLTRPVLRGGIVPTLLVGPLHGELSWQLWAASVPEPAACGASDGFRNFSSSKNLGRGAQMPPWTRALRMGMAEEGQGAKVPGQKSLLRGQRKQSHG